MIKKFFLALSTIILSFAVFAQEPQINTNLPKIEDGKQYTTLSKFSSPEKEVVEIFSFNCPSCYRLDIEYKVGESIKNNLPEGVKFKKYSLDTFGPLAKELSEAWAIANILGIEANVSAALYKAIHVDRSIKTADDIKAVFATLGVDSDKYESMKSNFLVKAFMTQQEQAKTELQPTSIPSFYVNGKYLINSNGLNNSSSKEFVKDYSRVANSLVELK